jgi:hypothetical protein
MRDGKTMKTRKQLLDELKKNKRYWNLKEELLWGEFCLEGAMVLSQTRMRN